MRRGRGVVGRGARSLCGLVLTHRGWSAVWEAWAPEEGAPPGCGGGFDGPASRERSHVRPFAVGLG